MSYLPFISDKILVDNVTWVLLSVDKIKEDDGEFYKNAIDPFSAIFDAMRQNISLNKWMGLEKIRQGQKALQNRLGDFHQSILGSMPGWTDLKKGNLIDLKNDERKVIAEVKNKYNTTKGSDKIQIYDNFTHALNNTYHGYTAYYVEVIPKNRMTYNHPFTPSDNKISEKRSSSESIRVIDGKSFYSFASGYPNALKMLYEVLPLVIGDILSKSTKNIIQDDLFKTMFSQSFS